MTRAPRDGYRQEGDMRFRQFMFVTAAAIAAALSSAGKRAAGADDRQRRHRRRGDGSERTGSRRVGDRRNHRPADAADQERGDRRSGPLPHPRSAEGELRGVRARLRRDGLGARQKSEPGKIVNLTTTAATPKAAAEHYPAIYWYSMLKVPAEARIPARQHQDPGRVAQRREDQWLLRLPRARQQGDAHDPVGVRRHEVARTPGRAASCPGRR